MENSSNHFCACDFAVELTAQLDSNKLNACFVSSVEKLLGGRPTIWSFQEFSSGGELFRSSIVIENQADEAKMDIFLENRQIAQALFSRQLSQAEIKELKILGSIFLNQQRHINLCSFDQLTGVMNRQAFGEKIRAICKANTHQDRRHNDINRWLVLLDIDKFKQVNDKFGHLIGDEVLVLIGQILNSSFREGDYCFRYGGEEFAVILANVDFDQTYKILNRLRQRVENHKFPQVGQVTVSIGFVQYTPFAQPSELIGKADKALYYAKEHGRNQLHAYEKLVADGELAPEAEGSDIEFL